MHQVEIKLQSLALQVVIWLVTSKRMGSLWNFGFEADYPILDSSLATSAKLLLNGFQLLTFRNLVIT